MVLLVVGLCLLCVLIDRGVSIWQFSDAGDATRRLRVEKARPRTECEKFVSLVDNPLDQTRNKLYPHQSQPAKVLAAREVTSLERALGRRVPAAITPALPPIDGNGNINTYLLYNICEQQVLIAPGSISNAYPEVHDTTQ